MDVAAAILIDFDSIYLNIDSFKLMVDNQIPLKRAQTPEDIGKLVCFLTSDLASEITGQAINLDGGAQLN